MEELDLSKYSIRTDLAIEAREIAIEHKGVDVESNVSQIEGVIIKEREIDDIKVSLVEVTAAGEEAIGKKKGSYLTIEVQGIREQNTETQAKVEKVLATELANFLNRKNISKDSSCLVVGLGNWNVTPDALGPAVVENLVVTRHLFELQPHAVEEGI